MKFENSVFPAAVYLSAGSDVCYSVFENDAQSVVHNADEALKCIKNSINISQNQKKALYLYMYLYARLLKKPIEKGDFVKDAFGITKGFQRNIDLALTDERIRCILELYTKEGKNVSCIFAHPNEFVVQMIDDIICMPVIEEKKRLKGLTPDEYEHPLDKAALNVLKSSSSIKTMMKFYTEYAIERAEIVKLTGSSFKITADNIPYAYDALEEACKALDIRKMPELYISDIGLNAYTTGSTNTILVLGSACLSLLSHDELMFILGHELGHIKSNHIMYHEFARVLPLIGKTIGDFTPFGIGDIISSGLSVSIMEWYRKSEFTADRAGLLVCQNPDAAFTVMTKLSGYPMKYYSTIDKKYILEQARRFEGLDGDGYNKIVKILSVMNATHPWTVMRAKEMNEWINDGSYDRILSQKAINDAKKYENSSFKVSFK